MYTKFNFMNALYAILTSLFLFSMPSLSALDSYNVGDQLYVLAPSGLRMRSAPQNGKKIELIPYSGKVIVVEVTEKAIKQTIEGLQGRWIKVRFKFNEGYVFDGFLSHIPAPLLGNDNFGQYLKAGWKAILPKTDSSLIIDGMEIFFTRQSFQYNGRKAYFTEDYNPDDESFTLTIENISKEEAYLLLHVFFRSMITNTKTLLRARAQASQDFDSAFAHLTEAEVNQKLQSYKNPSLIPEKLTWIMYCEQCFVEIGYTSTKKGWKIFVNRAAC